MLGVHYFFDVTAGWILGIILAIIVLLTQNYFNQLLPFVF